MKNKINSLSTVIILIFFFVSCNKTSNLSNGTFFVQDVANKSNKFQTTHNTLGLSIMTKQSIENNCYFVDVEISDTTNKDRAITLSYAMQAVEGDNWTWLEGNARSEKIKQNKSYISKNGDHHSLSFNHDRVGACANPISRYPFAAITNGEIGIGIGIDMSFPAAYRLGFDGDTKQLYIAYDLGFVPENNEAELRFVTFTFDPKWGFRGALARYYEIFPEDFVNNVPSPKQGLWMPCGKISKIEGWKDFGFRFKETISETKWDNANDLLTFNYVEPLSFWMPMPHDKLPKRGNLSEAEYKKFEFQAIQDYLKYLQSIYGKKELDFQYYPHYLNTLSNRARSVPSSVYHNPDGTPYHGVTNMPWCTGVLWGINSMPGIKGEYTDFKIKWHKKLIDELYNKPKKNGVLSGTYIDSAEGFVGYLDFNRKHFSAATTPLTFDRFLHKPGIFRGMIAYEFIRAIAKDVHGMDKLMMANHTPCELSWLAPLFDVMGTETDWNPNNKWRPMPIEDMFFRRAMCKTKPYCFLMNTNFDNFTYELMEKYMKRSIAFGISPGCFSADAGTKQYFTNPKLYNRDRELFKKYVPICNLVAEEGWEPIPYAHVNDKSIHIERFGNSYLTVFNPNNEERTVKITLDGIEAKNSIELVGERSIKWENKSTELILDGEDVAVIKLDGN